MWMGVGNALRKGKESHEYFVERSFFQWRDDNGTSHLARLIPDPVKLTRGKKMIDLFGTQKAFVPTD